MGLNKLENQIKEKLNSREIQPSAQAWDRLDAMLTVVEEKKTKRSYGWLYIAASVLVLLTVGMFLFTPKNTDEQNEVVNTEVKIDSVKKEQNKFQTPVNILQEEKENQIAEENLNQKSEGKNQVAVNQFQSSPEAQPNRLERSGKNQKQSNQNPLINREKQIEFQNSSDVALKDLPRVDTQTKIVVSRNEIPASIKGNLYKSDEDLLANLDKAGKKSSNQKSSFKVDAKSLLSQVDGEIELTFRERVIQKISKNYKEVKVALANRNQE